LRADSPALLDEAGGQRGPTHGTRWPKAPASPALLGASEGARAAPPATPSKRCNPAHAVIAARQRV